MDTALFSPSSLFQSNSSDDEDATAAEGEGKETAEELHYVERRHAFPGGMELVIREFSFHQLNANLLWPGTFAFSEWLVQNQTLLRGRRVLELGSGTGALAIFLQKSFGVGITTSDFDDKDVEENIAYNCRANGVAVLPHIRHFDLANLIFHPRPLTMPHVRMGFMRRGGCSCLSFNDTWGDTFPVREPDWDLVIASDILLYVKQYPNLIKTLCFLLNSYKPKDQSAATGSSKRAVTISGKEVQLQWPMFLMSWRRRIGREDEELFFTGCKDAGLVTEHLGSRVYCVSPRR